MMIAAALKACELCGFYTCPEQDQCATVLRLCREDDARRAEAGLPPFAESTEEGDAAILRDPYAITCHTCGTEATHSDDYYGWCAKHAPEDAEGAVF
jgi:hypothetical protein